MRAYACIQFGVMQNECTHIYIFRDFQMHYCPTRSNKYNQSRFRIYVFFLTFCFNSPSFVCPQPNACPGATRNTVPATNPTNACKYPHLSFTTHTSFALNALEKSTNKKRSKYLVNDRRMCQFVFKVNYSPIKTQFGESPPWMVKISEEVQ